jgi:exonuclease III
LNRNYIAKDIKTIKLGTHNINELKVNSHKLDVILDWALENDIDILGINETNIAEQQEKFMIKKDSNYVGF